MRVERGKIFIFSLKKSKNIVIFVYHFGGVLGFYIEFYIWFLVCLLPLFGLVKLDNYTKWNQLY